MLALRVVGGLSHGVFVYGVQAGVPGRRARGLIPSLTSGPLVVLQTGASVWNSGGSGASGGSGRLPLTFISPLVIEA